MAASDRVKHRQVYETIHRALLSGDYGVGDRLPSEAELMDRFGVSRPTVARALRDLEKEGYLLRRRGLGTFVREHRTRASNGLLGITVPRTEGGILAPICAEIVRRAEASGFGVLYAGNAPLTQRDAIPASVEAYCEQFIKRQVDGVFFLPLITNPEDMQVNRQIAHYLSDAGLAVTLLDRDVVDFPERSRFDLVGVDNRRNGYVLTAHLLKAGCERIHFVTIDKTASTCTSRIAGWRDALNDYGITPGDDWLHVWHADDGHALARHLAKHANAEALVCVNDDVARALMHHFAVLGVKIPRDLRIVGSDELPFAATLPVPLTTMRQPTRFMGLLAVETMLSRIETPQMPARDVMLVCDLIVRESCGSNLPPKQKRVSRTPRQPKNSYANADP